MPVYKGNAEVTSGSLKKGTTNIENGYKQTDQFYVNTNAITINFVDAISGATMNTTQFSSIGTPGTAFSSFTRTISVDSGRIWLSNPTVSESGDTGGNVNASISGITSTSATLNVSGTHPNTGVTITLTVNGSTQVQLPNLNVGKSGDYPTVATADSGTLNTFSYSVSNSSGCSGGTSGSGSLSSGSSSYTWYGYSRPGLVPGPYGNGCGETCNSSVTFSKSGYNSGGTTFSQTGTYPSAAYTCYAGATSGVRQDGTTEYRTSSSCVDNTPSSISVSGSASCFASGPHSLGCSSCMYSSGVSGPSISWNCPSVPRNGSSTSSTSCSSPTFPGLSLSGGSLSPSLSQSGSSYFYVNPGPIVVSYNTNYDNYTRPDGRIYTTCTANGQSHTDNDYISSGDVGVPSGQFQSGTTNSSLSISDHQLFSPGDFGLSSFSGTSVSCTSTMDLSTNIYSNSHTISGSGSFTVN
jgi:hypothetical protein